MNFVKLNRVVGLGTVALIPVVIIAVTIAEPNDNSELGAKWLLTLLAAWLPFYCFRCIETGHIHYPTLNDVYRSKTPVVFWLVLSVFMVFSLMVLLSVFSK